MTYFENSLFLSADLNDSNIPWARNTSVNFLTKSDVNVDICLEAIINWSAVPITATSSLLIVNEKAEIDDVFRNDLIGTVSFYYFILLSLLLKQVHTIFGGG